MLPLLASIIAPIVGAHLYVWLHDRSGAARIFDRCMAVVVPALVAWTVLEMTIELGLARNVLPMSGMVLLGLALPLLIEKTSKVLAPHTDNLALVLTLAGLTLHVFLEGAALTAEPENIVLPVTVHRLLVGLAIWWVVRLRHGFWVAALGIIALATATVGGYVVGGEIIPEGGAVELFQAFVGGSLLHVVFHQRIDDHQH